MALTLIQTQTATNQSSLTFTTGMSSPINHYFIIFHTVSAPGAVPGTILLIQISKNGGSSYITSGYRNFDNPSGGFQLSAFKSASDRLSGTLYLLNMTSGSGYVTSSNQGGIFTPGSSAYVANCSGAYDNANIAMNAFRIVMSNGANFSGEFSLYSLDS